MLTDEWNKVNLLLFGSSNLVEWDLLRTDESRTQSRARRLMNITQWVIFHTIQNIFKHFIQQSNTKTLEQEAHLLPSAPIFQVEHDMIGDSHGEILLLDDH